MLTRILTSIVAIMVLLPVLFLSDTIVFPIAIALVTVIGLWEMFNCIGLKNKYAMTAPAFLAGAVLPFAVKYTSAAGSGLFSSLIVIYALYLFAAAVFGHKSVSVTDAAMAFISSVAWDKPEAKAEMIAYGSDETVEVPCTVENGCVKVSLPETELAVIVIR